MLPKTFCLAIIGAILFTAVPLSARSWQEICDSGKLQILTTDTSRDQLQISGLPRCMMPIDREQALLESFARKHQLKIEYIRGPNFKMLFKLLDIGRGDLISANLADTQARREDYLLSIPFAYTREMFFTGEKSKLKGTSWKTLTQATAVLLPGTTYVENFRRFAQGKKGLKFRELDKTVSHDELMEMVADGKIAYSALNESSLNAWLAYRGGIRKLFPLRSGVPLVFAARSDSGELITQLDAFIRELAPEPEPAPPKTQKAVAANAPQKSVKKSSEKTPQQATAKKVPKKAVAAAPGKNDPLSDDHTTADLDKIRKRGYIRMLTTNDAFGCFLHRGQLMGFEYELAKRFGEGIQVRIVTVIVADFSEVCQMLIDGKGDFIAANFSLTPERVKKYPQLTFCKPYAGATQILIGRENETITSAADLAGRRVCVSRGTNCHDTLLKLQKSGIKFEIVPLPESMGNLPILRNISEGKYDLVAMDDIFLAHAQSAGCRVKKLFALSAPEPFVWVVRKKNPKLASAINAFFTKEHKSAFYNLCYKRYFNVRSLPKVKLADRNKKLTSISPYDTVFRKYAVLYGFNWCFIAAQSYQESHFDPTRVNYVGATGLMQVTPITAKELGITDLTEPDNGIHAGTKYMAKLRKRFDDKSISPEDQLCFSLAAYNAGYGHVQDARKLAAKLGLNPNVWFGNTEKALALLETPSYAARAKFGYCRASETIPYVANIMLQSHHYESLFQLQKEKAEIINQPIEKKEK